MMRKLDSLISEARKAAVEIRNFQGMIRVICHYDADGISSASIMAAALSREGKTFKMSILKQLSEQKIKDLGAEKNLLTVFTDLGSGHIKNIQECMVLLGAKVIILDHHQIKGEILQENSRNIIHINPLLFGITENLSGAGVVYFLAKELDTENTDLSYLAVTGAIGDSQTGSIEESWGLSGPNREILKDAKKSGKLLVSRGLRIWGMNTRPLHKALEYCTDPHIPGVSGSESASVQFLNELGIQLRSGNGWRTLSDLSEEEKKILATGIIKERIRDNQKNPHEVFGDVYEIPGHPSEFSNANEFATMLNACGKLGKPYVGLSMCMGDSRSFEEAKVLLVEYRKDIGKAISWMHSNRDAIMTTDRCTYMLAGSNVSEHIISNIVSIFNKSGFVSGDRPVLAFAEADDGNIKVSARAHDMLVEKGINMEVLVSDAAARFGGEGGGHKGAAGATIPKDAQEFFISYIEELLGKANGLTPLTSCAANDVEKATQSNLNINTPEQQETLERRCLRKREGAEAPSDLKTPSNESNEVVYGTAESEREGRGEGRTEGGSESSQGRERPAKKMEGQGLVRYFSS